MRIIANSLFFLLVSLLGNPAFTQQNKQLFKSLPSEKTGINFMNELIEDSLLNILNYQYLYNGGGVAVGDLNNDGWSDIYFTGNQSDDALYLNNGDWTFTDISASSGINKISGWSTGVTMEDVNSDGYLDIYVCRSGKFGEARRSNKLFINNKDLTFTEQASDYGLDDAAFSTQAAFLDYDKDGDPDLFLLNHSVKQYSNFNIDQLRNQRDPQAGNKLYRNDGGRFVDVSEAAGIIGNPINFGLGVVITDFDNNGWPDIFCTNDYQEQDFFYLNNGDGTFSQVMQYATGHTSLFSMGADFGDVNNDGFVDFVVADMLPEDPFRRKMLKGPQKYDAYQMSVAYGFHHQFMRNTLQINNANGTFSEVGQYAGIHSTDWSWSPLLADFDNDGFQDLYVTNGYLRDFTNMDFLKYTYNEELTKAASSGKEVNMLDLINKMPSVKLTNYLYINEEDLNFENITSTSGIDIPSFSNGAAYADLDNDGDLDLIVNNLNDTAFVFQNNSSNAFLTVKLKGPDYNPLGLGAKVSVYGKSMRVTRELYPTRGYQSCMEHRLHFGLGKEFVVDLQVEWPDGKVQVIKNVRSNSSITIDHKDKSGSEENLTPEFPPKMFTTTDAIPQDIIYKNNVYIDFKREPLLTWTFSDPGPSIAVADFNGDGLEDFYFSAPKDGSGKLVIQNKGGKFEVLSTITDEPAPHDEIAVQALDVDNDGDFDLVIAYGGNEVELNNNYHPQLLINDGKGNFSVSKSGMPEIEISASCVVPGDFDADGDMDLFIGAKLLPGKYPLSTSSYVLRNDGGKYTDITATFCPALTNAGMITDAVWMDADQNGDLDLIVTGMWMPVRVFLQNNGTTAEQIDPEGMTAHYGWWNCLIALDADGDGDEDLFAGNTGNNFAYSTNMDYPVELYAMDFDGNGVIDPIICRRGKDGIHPLVSRDDLLEQINPLKKRFVRYETYSNAKLAEDIFPDTDLNNAIKLKATTFESTIFLNNGLGGFSASELPASVQLAPVQCAASEDINQDGKGDLFLAGNKMNVRPEVGRMDAGQGLFLQSSPSGYQSLKGWESGIYIPFEASSLNWIVVNGKKHLLVAGADNNLVLYNIK